MLRRVGWRGYAIPILLALTVVAVLQVARNTPRTAASTPVAQTVTTVVSGVPTTVTVSGPPATVTETRSVTGATAATAATGATAATATAPTGPDPSGSFSAAIPSGALPPGEAFTARGKGTWHVVAGTSPARGSGARVFTYTVEVEDGIEPAAADKEFAAKVDAVLADPRSWIGSGDFTLRRIDRGQPSFRISLTSQMTVRSAPLCGWDIHLEASCYARSAQRVVINNARWTRGAVSFNGDLGSYRVYAVNHEVGHALGYHHQPCGQNGGLAPVMMQQSWSTADDELAKLDPQTIPPDGRTCHYNPYPFPRGH
ncbi:DUF3152 domain-containing protein [Nakamurella endophytica]|uniref:DUF3152 domain-containing protein n=1 Tax=Nakamurella endophytica TaxID=1748367 RepID=A0A917WN46_9ACTN|nr:DUF3152 domain-containing protein [Nakamurella endophytica]GGM17872.1 hypothetical protein GCM10011594_42490 [Nakamurella endophytica]